MEKQEIIESNELIAHFMGMKLTKGWAPKGSTPFVDWKVPEDSPLYSIAHTSESLYFHSSWDWLMPVVEKIESLGYHTTCSKTIFHISRNGSCKSKIPFPIIEFESTKRENTYLAIVKFIKWYNTTQSKN